MTAGDDRINQHRLAGLQVGDPATEFGDDTGGLVAHDNRVVHARVPARVDFQICAADRRCHYSNQNLAGRRRGHAAFVQLQLPRRFEDDGLVGGHGV